MDCSIYLPDYIIKNDKLFWKNNIYTFEVLKRERNGTGQLDDFCEFSVFNVYNIPRYMVRIQYYGKKNIFTYFLPHEKNLFLNNFVFNFLRSSLKWTFTFRLFIFGLLHQFHSSLKSILFQNTSELLKLNKSFNGQFTNCMSYYLKKMFFRILI